MQKIFNFTSSNSWCSRIMTCFLRNLRDCVKHLTSQRPGAERSDRVHGRPHSEQSRIEVSSQNISEKAIEEWKLDTTVRESELKWFFN